MRCRRRLAGHSRLTDWPGRRTQLPLGRPAGACPRRPRRPAGWLPCCRTQRPATLPWTDPSRARRTPGGADHLSRRAFTVRRYHVHFTLSPSSSCDGAQRDGTDADAAAFKIVAGPRAPDQVRGPRGSGPEGAAAMRLVSCRVSVAPELKRQTVPKWRSHEVLPTTRTLLAPGIARPEYRVRTGRSGSPLCQASAVASTG